MNVVKFFSALAFGIVLTSQGFAQGEIPVSMYTGTPGIGINLYTVRDHDLSESISLSYDLSELRIGSEHRYGVGWTLAVGGAVSRKVRGLPDDFKGVGSDHRRGWLYNSNYTLTFPNVADTLVSTISDEQSDWTFIISCWTLDLIWSLARV
jgi:hypothetical protein